MNDAIMTPVGRLSRDLKVAAATMGKGEVRYLTDAYYQMQADRIRASHQSRTLSEAKEPSLVLDFIQMQSAALEDQIKKALDLFTKTDPVGQWMRGHKGVGPVIAAGLLSHIDIHKAPTVGHIWRFAGLDPTSKWGKGEKRPWNARLKVVCWKLGESFVKVSGSADAYYGQVYKQRKILETERNEAGDFAAQAAASLAEKNYSKDTEAYKAYAQGMLPKARIQLRAERYAVKLFLAHMHEVWYRHEFKVAPPVPYPIAFQGHAHYIAPPTGPGMAAAEVEAQVA